jgi:carbamoyl-phosphate synthase small subunit
VIGNPRPGLLLLEDGTAYRGRAVAPGTRFGEVVFNTSMTGYQEILTDPSYLGQIVVLTQPHIGNYGMSPVNEESGRPWAEGLVIRRLTAVPSSHGSQQALPDYLRRHGLPALEGIDSRALVRRLRDKGALRGVLTSERTDEAELPALLEERPRASGPGRWRRPARSAATSPCTTSAPRPTSCARSPSAARG